VYLKALPIEKVWGIGPQTSAYLKKQGIVTALQFARTSERWVRQHLSKTFYEIWQELNGNCVLELATKEKTSYASVQKVKTFTPPSSDRNFVLAQLSKNIENACMKVRRYSLAARSVIIFLKTQDFRYVGTELKFVRRTALPNEIIQALTPAFDELFSPGTPYRATGVVLGKLEEDTVVQLDLFGGTLQTIKLKRLFAAVDHIRERSGKHTLFLGSSFLAHRAAQHAGERGDNPQRKTTLLKGETARRRLAIPMFLGKFV